MENEKHNALIEFHRGDIPFTINAHYFAGAHPLENGGCEIFMVGDRLGEGWNTDEEYEEVMRKIREVIDG